jgi:hypothetical protein
MPLKQSSVNKSIARVIVSPPAVTLAESTAVLRRLQSFGPVTSFTQRHSTRKRPKPSKNNVEQQLLDVVFSNNATAQIACDASPLVVKINHNLPNPSVEDPFNLRGLQSREQPRPTTMTCLVEAGNEQPQSGQNILSNGFSPSIKTRLHQSLFEAGPPPSIVEGVAEGLGVLHSNQSDILVTAHVVEQPPDLMAMYRASRGSKMHWEDEKEAKRPSTPVRVGGSKT